MSPSRDDEPTGEALRLCKIGEAFHPTGGFSWQGDASERQLLESWLKNQGVKKDEYAVPPGYFNKDRLVGKGCKYEVFLHPRMLDASQCIYGHPASPRLPVASEH